jgi:hypothetical protein
LSIRCFYLGDEGLARQIDLFPDVGVSIRSQEEALCSMSAVIDFQACGYIHASLLPLDETAVPMSRTSTGISRAEEKHVKERTLYPLRSRAFWTMRRVRWIGGCGTTIPSFSNRPNDTLSLPPKAAGSVSSLLEKLMTSGSSSQGFVDCNDLNISRKEGSDIAMMPMIEGMIGWPGT